MAQRAARMPNRFNQSRLRWLSVPVIAACLGAAPAAGQTARDVRGAAAVEPLLNEASAKIIIDPPLAEPLTHGRVVIQYRTENLHMAPLFGLAALAVSPRVGHIHVSVDDAAWVWVDASGEPVILNGLSSGRHKVLIQLESANHHTLDQGAVTFVVPEVPAAGAAGSHTAGTPEFLQNQPTARIVLDAPRPEPLLRGVVFLSYRTENLQIVPVFGPAALAVSPRVGHIHVTVDDAKWHWADASGVPVIINGLAPGQHKILIELVNANHKSIDQKTVDVSVPAAKAHPES